MVDSKPTAAAYCRISSDRSGDGLGVARQERDCREWCARRGWPVADVFVDNDTSAYSGKPRRQFNEMVEGIKAGRYDAIVVWHPDRLTRSTKELEAVIDLVEATGVQVGSVTSGLYDLGTADGRLTARVVGAVARKESEDKSRRLRRKHAEIAEQGRFSGGGPRRFGFKADHIHHDRREAGLIREAARRVLDDDERLRGICRDWSERGIRTADGKQWQHQTLRRILMSARIAGLREHETGSAKAVWRPIISAEDHVRLVAKLADPARRMQRSPTRYLLTQFVTCSGCGKRMASRPKGEVRRYVCAKDSGGCGHTYIKAADLEEVVTSAVMERVTSSRKIPGAVSARKAKAADPLAKVAEAETRQVELAEMWAAGSISKAAWAAASKALDRQLAEARSRIVVDQSARLLVGLPTSTDELRAMWESASFDRRRAILGTLIESVTIGAGAPGRFTADRIDISWRR